MVPRIDITRLRQLLGISNENRRSWRASCRLVNDELPKLDKSLVLLETIKTAMGLSEKCLDAMNQTAIIRALRPATAARRLEGINDPAANTFAWILEEPAVLGDKRSETSSVLENYLLFKAFQSRKLPEIRDSLEIDGMAEGELRCVTLCG